MFVEIIKEEGKPPIVVDRWIKKVRDDGFTPDEAMQVLKWSNFYGNIKRVVKEINKYKTKEERLAFKEFVLSSVDRRETSSDSLSMLRALAVDGGYEKEFDKANAKTKVYSLKGSDFCSTIEEWYENKDKYNKVIYISTKGIEYLFADTDGKAPKELIMKDCDKVEFAKSVDMDRLVLINVGKVNLVSMSKLPKNVELSDCGVVDFSYTDLSMSNISFKNCRSVVFIYATKFPAVLDLSEVDEVDLSYCDLKDVKEIKFKKGAKVNLQYTKNLSPSLDLSGLAGINICGVDVSYIEDAVVLGTIKSDESTRLPKKMTFTGEKVKIYKSNIEKCEEVVFAPSVKKVVFDSSTKFPEVLDLSEVDEVDLYRCDLANVKEIKFKKGSKVDLSYVKNLSPSIDLTAPAELTLKGVDVSYIEDSSVLGTIKSDESTRLPKKMVFKEKIVNIYGVNIEKCEEIVFAPSVKKVVFGSSTKFPEVSDLSEVDEVDLFGCDLANVKEIKFKKGAKVGLYYVKNLSPSLDLTAPAELTLKGVDVSYIEDAVVLGTIKSDESTRLPKKMTFTGEKVNIYKSNIEKCEEVVFAPSVKKVVFDDSTKFPEVLDLSEVDEVDLQGCDLKDVKEIKFKKGANVNLKRVKNLSPDIDLSDIGIINISGVDLSYIEDDSIWDGVEYDSDTRFPKKVTFKCKNIIIENINIEKCKEVVFGPKVKKVEFSVDTKFPERLEFSQCEDVEIQGLNVRAMKRILLRDEAQRDMLMDNLQLSKADRLRFKIKCKYVDDKSKKGSRTISVPQKEMGE